MIRPEKLEELNEKLSQLGVEEKDLEEKFILGSGSGGQKINKSNSCVYLKHLPSGIEVKCQRDRSREANRFFARRELVEKLEQRLGIKTKRELSIEKIRRQKKKRKRRSSLKYSDN